MTRAEEHTKRCANLGEYGYSGPGTIVDGVIVLCSILRARGGVFSGWGFDLGIVKEYSWVSMDEKLLNHYKSLLDPRRFIACIMQTRTWSPNRGLVDEIPADEATDEVTPGWRVRAPKICKEDTASSLPQQCRNISQTKQTSQDMSSLVVYLIILQKRSHGTPHQPYL